MTNVSLTLPTSHLPFISYHTPISIIYIFFLFFIAVSQSKYKAPIPNSHKDLNLNFSTLVSLITPKKEKKKTKNTQNL